MRFEGGEWRVASSEWRFFYSPFAQEHRLADTTSTAPNFPNPRTLIDMTLDGNRVSPTGCVRHRRQCLGRCRLGRRRLRRRPGLRGRTATASARSACPRPAPTSASAASKRNRLFMTREPVARTPSMSKRRARIIAEAGQTIVIPGRDEVARPGLITTIGSIDFGPALIGASRNDAAAVGRLTRCCAAPPKCR